MIRGFDLNDEKSGSGRRDRRRRGGGQENVTKIRYRIGEDVFSALENSDVRCCRQTSGTQATVFHVSAVRAGFVFLGRLLLMGGSVVDLFMI